MGKVPSRLVAAAVVAWKRTSDISTATWLWSLLPSGALSVIAAWRASIAGVPDWAVLVIALAVLALVMIVLTVWKAWRSLSAESKPVAELTFGEDAAAFSETKRERLIAAGRDLVHQYRAVRSPESFRIWARRHRAFMDIQPYLGLEYDRWAIRNAERPHKPDASLEDAMFLHELARLEKEWELV